jgi:PTS system mannose-specific IID component
MDALRGVGWRLWFLQASWNREGMQSLGLVACALPWARRRAGTAEPLARWIRRRLAFVNTNPYLAGLLLGAEMRLEEEGRMEDVDRLGPSLSRSLGAVGDSLTWETFRPAFALLGLAFALALGPMASLAAWLLFAVSQGWLRQRALVEGYSRGLEVVGLAAHPRVHAVVEGGHRTVLVGAGAAVGAALATVSPAGSPPGLGLAVGIALVCGILARTRPWPVERVLVGGLAILWILLRLGAWD